MDIGFSRTTDVGSGRSGCRRENVYPNVMKNHENNLQWIRMYGYPPPQQNG